MRRVVHRSTRPTVIASWGASVLVALTVNACSGGGGGSNPAAPTTPDPSTPAANLSGTWSGPASDSSGPGALSWQITQNGTAVSGPATFTDTRTGVSGRGTASGTVSGSAVHFTIAVAAGGFDPPFGSCTASISADAQATASSLTGTYTGTNSCAGNISNGQLMLTKK